MKNSIFVVVSIIVTSWVSLAKAEPFKDVPEKYRVCTVCHGAQLRGNEVTKAPTLATLPAWYIENQLIGFRNEWRGKHPEDYPGSEMYPVAESLSEKEISKVSKFIEALPKSNKHTQIVKGDSAKGKELYATCAACHGADAQGNEVLSAPPLLVQGDWYIKQQLLNFKNGLRGKVSDDARGATMAAAITSLNSDSDIDDIVAYLSTL
ncbi:c-type cytochrome [Sessilibacter corallicola]|uniref:Cytochrome c domain-containing protein n=1 Tax=Sessilibacter corallicola TaxID=2904075 RepID=A0ABQ0AD53_9GAMM|nr:c-type cytochrome [Sessilibacter corallicola]